MQNNLKKIFFLSILIFVFSFVFSTFSFAEGLMENNMMSGSNAIMQNDDGLPAEALAQAGHTAREEAEGKEIWKKLQAEELKCENLTDENFGALGEYFMGQMLALNRSEASGLGAGEQHTAMNNMMIQMIGEEGEKQMHVAMGKRMSGCEPNAQPSNMMGGGMMGGNNSMMGNFATNPTGWFGWDLGLIFMILFWGFIILAIVALTKWIMNQSKRETKSKSSL